jgi:pyrrolidone-carboxylate peptidase
VAYDHVLSVLPTILPSEKRKSPSPEIVLHIGLAAGRQFFALEQGSHAKGYFQIPDVDGQRFSDASAEEKFPSSNFPSALETSFDTADVLKRWRAGLGCDLSDSSSGAASRPDVQISHDAGNFLCGFIYYNSLAHFHAINENERPVAFMHVPDLSDSEEKMREGRDVAIALIKALVESRRKCGVVAKGEGAQKSNGDAAVGTRTDNNFA